MGDGRVGEWEMAKPPNMLPEGTRWQRINKTMWAELVEASLPKPTLFQLFNTAFISGKKYKLLFIIFPSSR
jgi:hypothetical protein